MKKIFISVLAVFCVIVSCKKTSDQSTEEATATSSALFNRVSSTPTITGAIISDKEDDLTTEFQITTLNKLNTNNTRTSLILDNYRGSWWKFETFNANEIKVFATICDKRATKPHPQAYPTDTFAYKAELDNVLDKYSPTMVVVENEETDLTKHTGSMWDYLNELKAAMTVVHEHRLLGSNGGLSTRPLTFLVYRNYFNNGQLAKAEAFGDKCIPDKYIYNLSHPGSDPDFDYKIRRWDTLVKAYRFINIDYVNIHIYEPIKYRCEPYATQLSAGITQATPGALQEICDYLKAQTGKEIMSNEMGQLNQQQQLVTSMLNVCNNVHLKYSIWYSGDGGIDAAVALHNKDGSLRTNGFAFRDYRP